MSPDANGGDVLFDAQGTDTPIETLAASFNKLQGRLRISVTHACQLACQFCHQEGIEDHWRPVHISPAFLKTVVEAYSSLGGKYVELTGGEPTVHPHIGELVDVVADPSRQLILCTNGLRLDRLQSRIEAKKIDYIKLSLHATESTAATRSLLGRAWDFERLRSNVERALITGVRFQLIYTHSQNNTEYLERVLRLALEWDTDLQVVDLIQTRSLNPANQLGYKSGEDAAPLVNRFATSEREVRDRTGAVLKLYKTATGRSWEIKDLHYGLLHSAMCDGCTKRASCGEGIYALRVDALGKVKPCLLRDDLQMTIGQQSQVTAKQVLETTLRKMLSGRLQWR